MLTSHRRVLALVIPLVLGALAASCSKSSDTETKGGAPTTAPPTAPSEPKSVEQKPAPRAEPKPAAKFATPDAKLARFLDCWNAFNSGKDDVHAGCFTDDAKREQVDNVPESVAQGAEKIVDAAKAQRAAFPDLKVTPQLVIVSGDDILAILHVGGTNTGTVAGMKTTGKKLGVFEAEHAVMNADGKITLDKLYIDQPTMFHQLGLLVNDSSPAAVAPQTATPETLVSHGDAAEAANKQVIERELDAINKKDAKSLIAAAAPDVKVTYHGEKQKVKGKDAYTKWLGETLHSTKDGFVDAKGVWTAGDYVVVEDVFSGTPSAGVVDKDAEGKHIETHVLQVFRVKGGKLAEQQIFANRLKTAVQLGMIDADELMKALAKAEK